jgi:peptide/nickel transport system substrate-binding protein
MAAVAVLATVAAACGSSSNKSSGKSTTSAGAAETTSTSVAVPQGGTLTIGAEQEPDCFDWMGTCGGSSWGYWMANVTTMPYALTPAKQADGTLKYEHSDLLTADPTLVTTPTQTVTYNLNPAAVWSDGVKITCDDFKYTWQQVATGKDIYDPTGYNDIGNVDCTNEEQPVVTYKTPYSGWQGLFGGGYGIFPAHILNGHDRDASMKNGYDWSGGPWFAKWTKGDNITLTPNPKYWGDKPKLDKVIFKFTEDTAAEFQAFKSNQVQMIYPQPQIDVIDAIGQGIPNANSVATANTGAVEALWIQNAHFPFDSKAVRQAFAYAIDRDAIVKSLFGKIGVDKAVNSLNPWVIAAFSDQNAFSNYHLDLTKVDSLMKGDGWTKGGDGIWAKNGKRAAFTLKTTQGNKRRQLTAIALQSELKAAGFDMSIMYRTPADLFGKDGPQGNFDVALFANQNTTIVPGLCNIMCTKNIPGPANQNNGQNWYHYSDTAADKELENVDNNLDQNAEAASAKKADQIMADDVSSLPLDPLPDIVIWSKKVIGPIGDQAILGPWWNLQDWGCTASSCT